MSGSFESIFKAKSKEEFAKNPVSLTGYLIDRKFPREDIAAYRTMARMCPAVIAKVLRGTIGPEEAANLAARQAKVDVSAARSLFDRMCSGTESQNKTIVLNTEPKNTPEPIVEKPPVKTEAIAAEKETEHPEPAPAVAKHASVGETIVDGMTFDLLEHECRLKLCNRKNPGTAIPKKVEGRPVTVIGSHAFSECDPAPFSVVLPDTVKTIEKGAFEDCRNLESIAIPEGVTAIEDSTFSGCYRLRSAKLPDTIRRIGDLAFFRCRSLKTNLPKSVEEIGKRAFEYCTSLESVAMPGVAVVKERCFGSCAGLSTVEFSDSMTSIEGFAFEYCTSLGSVQLPKSLGSIGPGAFRGCGSLKSVVVPDSVETIGAETFGSCLKLNSASLPRKLKVIEDRLFFCCGNLSSIEIPGSTERIGKFAFYSCELKSVEFPDTLRMIGDRAFDGCRDLFMVLLPERFETVGEHSFNPGCHVYKAGSSEHYVQSLH